MPSTPDSLSSALDEWRAIEQAADPGPWEVTGISYEDIWSESKGGFIAETFGGTESARLIVTARTAMPRLIKAVEAVLKLAGDWDREASGGPLAILLGARAQAHQDCAAALRETIRTALTGEEAGDG